MKILFFVVALSLTQASLLQGRSTDSTYSIESRSIEGSGSSSIPAVLAVRKGSGFSATDNVRLRSEDISSILNSGNFVTINQVDESGTPITYAAIPVRRNGNSYSVASDSLASLRQGAQEISLGGRSDGGYSSGGATVVSTRSEAGSSASLTYNDVIRVAANQNYAAPASSATRAADAYSLDTLRTAISEPVVVLQSSNIGSDAVNQRDDASYATKSSGSNVQRIDSTSSYSAEGSQIASTAPFSFTASTDSVSVSAQPLASSAAAVRNGNTYSAVGLTRSTPVVNSAASLTSTTRTGASYSSGVSNAPVVTLNRVVDSLPQNLNADRTSSYSGAVRTTIASAPGLRSGPVIIGGSDSETSQNNLYRNSIPGEPFRDYPIYNKVPPTRFTCKGQPANHGYYADVDAGCQVYHRCDFGKQASFLCPNGTLFNQEVRVCDWWFNVKCDTAPQFYHLNQDIGQVSSSSSRISSSNEKTLTNTRTTSYGENQESVVVINRAVPSSPASNTY